MPKLDVPVIKSVTMNCGIPKSVDVGINTHVLTNWYQVHVSMANTRDKDSEGNPHTYVLDPKLALLPPIRLETVKVSADLATDAQFGTKRPIPSGDYMCYVRVEVGWWKRVYYWDWTRWPFFRYKMMLVPQYPALTMSKYVGWR